MASKHKNTPWEFRLLNEVIIDAHALQVEPTAFWSSSWNPNSLYELVATLSQFTQKDAEDEDDNVAPVKRVISWTMQNALASCNNKNENYRVIDVEDTHEKMCRQVRFSAGGDKLVIAGFDGKSSVWDRSEDSVGQPRYVLNSVCEGHENEVKAAGVSACGKYLASCGRDRCVWVYEEVSHGIFDCINVLQPHDKDIKYVEWHPTELMFITCSYDSTSAIFAFDGEDFAQLQTLQGHSDTIWSSAWHPNGKLVATASQDQTIRFWSSSGLSASHNPSTKWFVQPAFGGSIKPTSTAMGSEQTWHQVGIIEKQHHDCIYSCAWNGVYQDLLATACGDDHVRLFRVDPNSPWKSQLLFQIRAHMGDVNNVAWNSTGHLLSSCGGDYALRIWAMLDTSQINEQNQGLPQDLADIWEVMRPPHEKAMIVPWLDRTTAPEDNEDEK